MAKTTAKIALQDVIGGTEGPDILNGTSAADTISGLGGNDELYGRGGNDVLEGGEGDDKLDGGAGRDVMRGGSGRDTYYVDNAGDQVIEDTQEEGWDIVNSTVSFTLGANVEVLFLKGNADLNGFGNDGGNDIVGNAGDNRLEGRGGNDYLHGGGGDDRIYGGDGDDYLAGDGGEDRLYGGAGNDYYWVRAGDTVIESANEGHDLVEAEGNAWMLSANVEDLILYGPARVTARGNALDNVIDVYDSDGGNLYGEGGNDTIRGASTERIYGGAGDDVLSGALANRIYGEAGNDIITVNTKADTVFGGAGTDTFNFYWSQTDGYEDDMVRSISDFDAAAGEQIKFSDHSLLIKGFYYGTVGDEHFYAADGAAAVAQTEEQHFIFDRQAGKLYYDWDGSGTDIEMQLIGKINVVAGELSASNLYVVDWWGGSA